MRLVFLCAILVALAAAQSSDKKAAPNPRDVKLAGNRFKPLTYDQMTPAQKTMIEHVINGERRGATGGPFNVMLRSPEMGDLAQALGAYARYHADMPAKLRELAILITARFWTVQFEWQAHHRAALQAGLSQQICDAIAVGKRPASMNPDEAAVYNFSTELLNTKQVSDAAFQAAVKTLGEKGVVDLMGLMGYYQIVAMMLNVDRYPLPEGVKAELSPLK
jgi:4-carboxymuconolactone decarboxylase